MYRFEMRPWAKTTQPSMHDGIGLVALDGASLSLERADIFENYLVGAVFNGDETTVSAIDVVIRDTIPWGCGYFGLGHLGI